MSAGKSGDNLRCFCLMWKVLMAIIATVSPPQCGNESANLSETFKEAHYLKFIGKLIQSENGNRIGMCVREKKKPDTDCCWGLGRCGLRCTDMEMFYIRTIPIQSSQPPAPDTYNLSNKKTEP